MPFILDDRKLRCCQDAAAAAEIEGRSHISIFQLESYSNEFAERGGSSSDKQMRINRVPLSILSFKWVALHFQYKDFCSSVFGNTWESV